MANGSFYKYVDGSHESNYFGLYCEYTFSQNTLENYTDVTVDVWIRYYSLNVGAHPGTITVGSDSVSFTGPAISDYPGGYGKSKLISKTIRVKHNDDGKKTGVSIKVVWNVPITYSGTYYSSLSASTTVDLPAIPRASTMCTVTCSTSYFDGTLTYKYTPQSANYYNRCNISLNVNGSRTSIKIIDLGKSTNAQQTRTVTLSSSELTNIYNALPKDEKGILVFTLHTYSDASYNTQVGGTNSKEITLYIPPSVAPTINNIVLAPVGIPTKDGNTSYILVKGKNRISVNIHEYSGGAGSSIKSYTFIASKDGSVIESKSSINPYTTFGPFSQTGSIVFNVAVTDNRGRTTYSEDELTAYCYDYDIPYFNSFKIYRANADGSSNINGAYIQCDYTPKYSSVNATNNVTVVAHYNNNTQVGSDGGILIDLDGDTSSTHKVYLTIEDNYYGTNKTSTVNIFGKSRILNITPDGTGIAIGKMADSSELFECRWSAKFDDSVTVPDDGGPVINNYTVYTLGPGTEIPSESNLDEYITPGVFYSLDESISETLVGSPIIDTGFKMVVDYLGDSTSVRQTIISKSANCQTYQRYKDGGIWYDWQSGLADGDMEERVLDIVNGSFLPLSGGTLTGTLNFGNTPSATSGIINFYRSAGYWDTLYATGGKLKFHTNRATGTSLSGNIVLSTGNFRYGTCTLSDTVEKTITFSAAFGGTPTVMLTPLTNVEGVIAGKVLSRNSSQFTAIIGGDITGTEAQFAYLAYY